MRRVCAIVAMNLGAALLAGCAGYPGSAQPGESAAQVQARWGAPTAEYMQPGGGKRLEYSGNPWGVFTVMVDVDGAGRVLQSRQVLSSAHFEQLQSGEWNAERVRREFGRPAEITRVASWDGPIWTYRYRDGADLMYHVYFDRQGIVRRSHGGPDMWLEVRGERAAR
jgi:hypothetical protein